MQFGTLQETPAPLSFGFGGQHTRPVPLETGSPNSRRRRRSDTDEDLAADAGLKRVRREVRSLRGQPEEVDAGKLLTSLSKSQLVTMLTTLLSQQPELRPAILALLPAPSLETFSHQLAAAERRVLDALPTGSNLRPEYIFNRVKTPLDDYVAEARSLLASFTSGQAGGDANHPTTIFTFLHLLTSSVRKLEALIPRPVSQPSHNSNFRLNPFDPLSSLIPQIFNQWHVLATRLNTEVNTQARIISAETIRHWLRQLDELASPLPGVVDDSTVSRKASEAVRERFIRELGWLVGLRVQTPTSMQED